MPRGIRRRHAERICVLHFEVRIGDERHLSARGINREQAGVCATEAECHPTRDIERIVGQGLIDHLPRATVLIDRWCCRQRRDRRSDLIEVNDLKRHWLRCREMPRGIRRDHAERIRRLRFVVRVGDERHLSAYRINREQAGVCATEAECHPTRDIERIVGQGLIDHLPRTTVLIDRWCCRRRRDRRSNLIEVDDVHRH